MIYRCLFLLIIGCASAGVFAKPTPQTIAEFSAGFPYSAFDTQDSLGRTIRFYLTDAHATDNRPLIVAIQGSGCASQFSIRDGRVNQGWHAFVRQAVGERAQVLIVEKPGVKLFDRPANPGNAQNCTADFKREQTQDRWLAALSAALRGAMELRGKAPQAVMALGHSEGAVFAPLLVAKEPAISHVAMLSASPLSQLHDFFDMARSGEGFISNAPGNKADHIKRVLKTWQDVSTDPTSDSKTALGHAYRYWADKFAPFDWRQLENTKARFFMAHGDADQNSSIRTFDTFAIELIIRKQDVTWLRIPGANHSFAQKDDSSGKGMPMVIGYAVAWLLGDTFDKKDMVWPLVDTPN